MNSSLTRLISASLMLISIGFGATGCSVRRDTVIARQGTKGLIKKKVSNVDALMPDQNGVMQEVHTDLPEGTQFQLGNPPAPLPTTMPKETP